MARGLVVAAAALVGAAAQTSITVDWSSTPAAKLKTQVALQVVVNPLIERKAPQHDNIFASLA